MYLTLCLIPVIGAILSKVRRFKDPNQVVDGTFCFRPEARCRPNLSNLLICSGLFLEFLQAALYCAPANVFCLGECQVEVNHQVRHTHHTYSTKTSHRLTFDLGSKGVKASWCGVA
jgi:hypothetical protein